MGLKPETGPKQADMKENWDAGVGNQSRAFFKSYCCIITT